MNAYSDIFAETDDYAAKARQIVRTQMRTAEDARKPRRLTVHPLPKPVEMPQHERPARDYGKGVAVAERSMKTRTAILNAMTGPMTAPRIAAVAGMLPASVAGYLRKMEAAGLVRPVPFKRWRNDRAIVWERTGLPADANLLVAAQAMSDKVTDQYLGALSSAKTAKDIAQEIGVTARSAAARLTILKERGLVKVIGKVSKAPKGAPLNLWVRT